MLQPLVIICTISDDPFAPAGHGAYGGSHTAIGNIGRYLVRAGLPIIFVTRCLSEEQEGMKQLGPKCKLYRIKGGPKQKVTYYELGKHIQELEDNFYAILDTLPKDPHITYLSYNWLSGELVRRVRKQYPGEHLHLVLALSASRLNGGEGTRKINEEWRAFEQLTFHDAKYIFCGSRQERQELLEEYDGIDEQKVTVINYGIDTNIFFKRPGSEGDYFRRSIEKFQERFDHTS